MSLLAGGISHGQAVVLVLLSVFLIIFVVADIYLVLFLHRKNKRLAQKSNLICDDKDSDDRNPTVNE